MAKIKAQKDARALWKTAFDSFQCLKDPEYSGMFRD